jgi:hypothetical protein
MNRKEVTESKAISAMKVDLTNLELCFPLLLMLIAMTGLLPHYVEYFHRSLSSLIRRNCETVTVRHSLSLDLYRMFSEVSVKQSRPFLRLKFLGSLVTF